MNRGSLHIQDLLPVLLLSEPKFFFNLQLEVIAGAAKLEDQLTNLFTDLRQALGAKDDQRHHKDGEGVGDTERGPRQNRMSDKMSGRASERPVACSVAGHYR